MATTLLLDLENWDIVIDASGNIALAREPYALAQDAASAIRTFLGECWWDTRVGVPYLTEILGKNTPLALIKQRLVDAALTVPNVVSAQVFISKLDDRTLSGQVQVVSAGGEMTATLFTAINPQGTG